MPAHLCPVCRAPRDAELRDHISPLAHLRISLIVGAVCALIYYVCGIEAAWRGVFVYLPIWAGAEFFHWARMREAAKCRVCDFDPVLYQKSPLEARRQVERKLSGFVDGLKGELRKRSPAAQKNAPETIVGGVKPVRLEQGDAKLFEPRKPDAPKP